MTKAQADAIAVLLHELRPGWGAPGVYAAVAEVKDREPFTVAMAALRAANNPANRTPAVIPLPGPHWLAEPGPRPAGWTPADLRPCGKCGKVHDPDDHVCPRRNLEANKRGAALAKQALLEAKTKERHQESEPQPAPGPAPSPDADTGRTTT